MYVCMYMCMYVCIYRLVHHILYYKNLLSLFFDGVYLLFWGTLGRVPKIIVILISTCSYLFTKQWKIADPKVIIFQEYQVSLLCTSGNLLSIVMNLNGLFVGRMNVSKIVLKLFLMLNIMYY